MTERTLPDIPDVMLDRELGNGGFADVFGGRDGHGRKVAVKVFKSGADDAIRLYQREVKVGAMLPESAYRPLYYGAGVLSDGKPYFVMEWIEGQSLVDRLVDGWRPNIQQACRIVLDVCSGLEALHEFGLAHSDVKPGNILMADDGRACIIDFGLVTDAEGLVPLLEDQMMIRGREFSSDTSEPMLAGTPRYFAPEQISHAMQSSSDAPAVDTATDVYALGALLYELVARRPLWPLSKPLTDPETMQSYVELRTSGLQPEAQLPSHIDPSLAGLIRRCVRHDLRERPRTARDLGGLIRRYLNGESVALDSEATLEGPTLGQRELESFGGQTIRRRATWQDDSAPAPGAGFGLVDPRTAGSLVAPPSGIQDTVGRPTEPLEAPRPSLVDDDATVELSTERLRASERMTREIAPNRTNDTLPLPVPDASKDDDAASPPTAPSAGPPLWLRNAVWAALGAALALAALALLLDW